jgi:SAM-dependent methyltransferase
MTDHHIPDIPSAWVARFAPMIPRAGRVLDLACGSGRHTRLLAALGHPVLAVDLDLSRLGDVLAHPNVTALQADLENAPWPLGEEKFAGIVVTNYLHRPLFPKILAALQTGGALIYETFAQGNERYGRPANPEFLLAPGELLALVSGLARVVAYEDLIVSEPKPAAVQRICAIRS